MSELGAAKKGAAKGAKAAGISMEDFFEDFDACPSRGLVRKVKWPWELVTAEKPELRIKETKILGDVHKSVVVKGKVIVGKGTVIDPFVVLEGPLVIGENCEVRSCAWIRPGTLVGNECVVGHGVELKNALVFNEAKIGTNCFVGDSVMAKGARVGSGTIIGNRRFDQKVVEIRIGDKSYSTGTDKFGAVLGEYSRLGANVSTSPGTFVGRHTWVYGGVLLSGFVPPFRLVKLRQQTELSEKGALELKQKDLKGNV